jgi:probable phosphoglycerate mutase
MFGSPLRRAVETAEIVGPALGDRTYIPAVALGYRWPDHSDGLTWEEHRQRFSLLGGGVFRPHEDGEESWAEFVSIVGTALYDIACEHAGHTTVVITHEEMIDASFRVFGNVALRGPFDIRVTPTSITEWTTTDDLLATGPPEWNLPRWRLERFNDAAHLEAPAGSLG